MSAYSAIDLSKLPAPDVIKTADFEALLAEMKAHVVSEVPELEAYLQLESDPAVKVLRACAWYRMLDRLEFNDGARGLMLALATGSTLDQLAANWNVERLIVQEADDSADPAIEEIKEGDAALRARVQLAMEGLSTAGPRGAYLFWALSASGEVKDAAVASPAPGNVLVTVLSHDGDGTASAPLLSTVEGVLNGEDVRPLCDTVTVQAATILSYQVEAELTLYEGPDASLVAAAAEEALAAYITEHHRLGHDITLSGIYAALHQPGVQNVQLTQPQADIVVGPAEAAFCEADALAITVGGRDV